MFTDETYIRAGGRPYKQRKVTVIEGQPTEERSQYTAPIYFQIMQWGAICEDTRVLFPSLLWEIETLEEKLKHQLEPNLENLTQRQIDTYRSIRARHEGTIERKVLSEVNTNIELHNQNHRAEGYKRGMKRARNPQHIFKPEKLVRGEKTRGINWFLYRKYILHERLFPYLQELQKLNTNRPIVVVEDGALCHSKAYSVCEAEYALLRLIRAPYTPNSPDLN
jgi:hypothetical protein